MSLLEILDWIKYLLTLSFPYSLLGIVILLGSIFLVKDFYKNHKEKIEKLIDSNHKAIAASTKGLVVLAIIFSGIYFVYDNFYFPDAPKDHIRVAISPFYLDEKGNLDSRTAESLKREIEDVAENRIEVIILNTPPITNDEDARHQGKKARAHFVIYGGDYKTVSQTFETEFYILPTSLENISPDKNLLCDNNQIVFDIDKNGKLLLGNENGKIIISPKYYTNETIRLKNTKGDISSAVYAICALNFYAKSEYNSAVELFEKVTGYKHEKVILYYIGNCNYRQNKYNESIYYYYKSIEVSNKITDPTVSDAWIGIGLALKSLNRPYEALNVFDKAIDINQSNSKAWEGRGIVLLELNKSNDSLKEFDKAIEVDPENSNAWVIKGMALGILNKHDEALNAFNKATEIDQGNPDAWIGKGKSFCNLNKPDEALNAFNKAVEVDSSYSDAWTYKGYILWELNEYDEAIRALDKAIELDPNNSDAWYAKGSILSLSYKFDEAIKVYDKGIQTNQNNSKLWTNKGLTLIQMKKYDEAMIALDRATKLDQKNSDAWSYKGLIFFILGKPDEATKAIDVAVELDPNSSIAWTVKGLILCELNKYDEAIKAFDKAIEIDPENFAAREYKQILPDALNKS